MTHDVRLEDVRLAIAAEIRAELARQKMTQRALAALTEIGQQTLHLRLTGERAFRGEELVVIAEALKVPVEQFLRTPERAA